MRAADRPEVMSGGGAVRRAVPTAWLRRAARLRPLSLLVLVVLAAASLGAFAVSRQVVNDQEQRLLAERADEVKALLSNALLGIDSSLQVLGQVGASTDPPVRSQFARTADGLLQGATKTIGVATDRGGTFTVASAVGDGPGEGQALSGARATLAARALAERQFVSDLISDGGAKRLVLTRSVTGTRAVIYQEAVLNPDVPVPSTAESPFRELRVALYASPTADPGRLVITTEADLPLSGDVEEIPFPIGAEHWMLAVGARESLAGSFARTVPWLLLGGGILMALMATATVEILSRRRAYALGLVADRTRELEQTLGELGEVHVFLQRLLTAGPVVVVRARAADQVVTYASPNVERILGVPQGDAVAPDFLAGHVAPEDAPVLAAAMERIAAGRSEREVLELRFRAGDDGHRWISVTLAPDADDPTVAVLGYVVDVDDRRRAEQAQREAQEAAETANRSKSQFLSRMSHELRTPLNAVLGFGQLLEMDDLSDTQRDSVEHILKGGSHLLDLINEVLDISRVEAGELSLSPEPVLSAELIREAVDLIRPLADQRGIQIVLDTSGACDCYVFADRQRFKQVLLNLLSNAVKYNRRMGTVALSCEQASETRVRIRVTDTGMGIPAERLGMLFTPFERLGAEQTGEEGTGIGLSLSKRLAEAMGGSLWADSTLGQGSTFTVELPRVEGPVERYERLGGEVAPATEPATGRHVVLHIEDNLASLTLIERVLSQRAEVQLVAAMQGRLGLELAREHQPVLVMLDLHLPDMGGVEVLQRLRDDPLTASIPVVIVSADASPSHAQRLLSAGAAAYLPKPVDVRELLRLLDEAMNGR